MSDTDAQRLVGAPIDEELVRVCAHNLLAAVDEAIYFKDRESRFILVSRGQARLLGAATPAEVVGKTDAEFFGDKRLAQQRALLAGLDRIDRHPGPIRPTTNSHTSVSP